MKIQLDPLLEFQTKIINDFESTDYAGRESNLVLPHHELVFPLSFFQEWLKNKKGFSNYMKKLFYRSLEKIKKEGIFIEEESIKNWTNFLRIRNKKYYGINGYMNLKTDKREVQIDFTKKPKNRL